MEKLDELRKLKEMLDNGLLTQAEFDEIKTSLIKQYAAKPIVANTIAESASISRKKTELNFEKIVNKVKANKKISLILCGTLVALVLIVVLIGGSSPKHELNGTWNNLAGGEIKISGNSYTWNMYELDGLERSYITNTYTGTIDIESTPSSSSSDTRKYYDFDLDGDVRANGYLTIEDGESPTISVNLVGTDIGYITFRKDW